MCLQEFTPPLVPAAGQSPPAASDCCDWASLLGTALPGQFLFFLGAVVGAEAMLGGMPTPSRDFSSGRQFQEPPPGDLRGHRQGPHNHKMYICKSFMAAVLRGLACNHIPTAPTSRTAFIIGLARGRMLRARQGREAVFRGALKGVWGWGVKVEGSPGGGVGSGAGEASLEGQQRKTDSSPSLSATAFPGLLPRALPKSHGHTHAVASPSPLSGF